jgi:hypothetical protein
MAHRLAISVLAGVILAAGTAFAGRGERVSGDDDPIIVSRSTTLPDDSVTSFDPETTGSVGKAVRPRDAHGCERMLLFPERPPEQQYEEAC